jgi:hypothetical protein
MFIIGREYANHLAKSAVVRSEFDNHIKQLFMVLDSSGDAQLNVAEFVMFIITTKQVQVPGTPLSHLHHETLLLVFEACSTTETYVKF